MWLVTELFYAFPYVSAMNAVCLLALCYTHGLPDDNINRRLAVSCFEYFRLLFLFPSALSSLFIVCFVEIPRLRASMRARERRMRLMALLMQLDRAHAAEATDTKTWQARVRRIHVDAGRALH